MGRGGLGIKAGEVGSRTARNIAPLTVPSSRYEFYSFPLSLVSPVFSCACAEQDFLHRVVQCRMKLVALSEGTNRPGK